MFARHGLVCVCMTVLGLCYAQAFSGSFRVCVCVCVCVEILGYYIVRFINQCFYFGKIFRKSFSLPRLYN